MRCDSATVGSSDDETGQSSNPETGAGGQGNVLHGQALVVSLTCSHESDA